MHRRIIPLLLAALVMAGCGQQAAAPVATSAPAPTAAPAPTSAPAPTEAAAQADLGGIKVYLLDKAGQLKTNTAKLKAIGDQYYEQAKAANFDYAALWKSQKDAVVATVEQGRDAWTAASPLYEQIEGIVAGTPSLADYDVILDAGSSAEEDPASAVPFDLALPDGRVLPKPGNLDHRASHPDRGAAQDLNCRVIAVAKGAGRTGEGRMSSPETPPTNRTARTLC